MTEFRVVDLDRHVYGDPDAPMRIVEYGDYECPYCGPAAPVLKELVAGSGARVRLVFRHFPLFRVHPFGLTTALAAEAAGKHFWELSWSLFAHQTRLTDAGLQGYADELGAGVVTGEVAQSFRPSSRPTTPRASPWG